MAYTCLFLIVKARSRKENVMSRMISHYPKCHLLPPKTDNYCRNNFVEHRARHDLHANRDGSNDRATGIRGLWISFGGLSAD